MPPYFFVFDVESIGLHGEGFAFGYVLVNREGEEIRSGGAQCNPDKAACGVPYADREWVARNIPVMELTEVDGPRELRSVFWAFWKSYQEQYPGVVMVADCAWPVEARFLIACVNDDIENRNWEGPYPLHDLASILLANGIDPLATNEREPSELPAHNPLCDALQSKRLLIEALNGL